MLHNAAAVAEGDSFVAAQQMPAPEPPPLNHSSGIRGMEHAIGYHLSGHLSNENDLSHVKMTLFH